MLKNIEIELTTEMILILLQGNKLEYQQYGQAKVVILPPVFGKFIKYEKYYSVKNIIVNSLMNSGMSLEKAGMVLEDLFVEPKHFPIPVPPSKKNKNNNQ